MCTKNHNDMIYSSWEMVWGRHNSFVILGHFLPFTPSPPNDPEKENFQKLKKIPGDIILLHMCTINEDHIKYIHVSWNFSACQTDFFVILGHFLSFHPPENWENQTFEKMKKRPGNNIIFQMCTFFKCIPWITHGWQSYDV